jgi:hypothetical protein
MVGRHVGVQKSNDPLAAIRGRIELIFFVSRISLDLYLGMEGVSTWGKPSNCIGEAGMAPGQGLLQAISGLPCSSALRPTYRHRHDGAQQ